MANVLPLATTRAKRAPKQAHSWRETLATATAKAERMLPAHLQGEGVGETVLDKARSVLARIKRALGPVSDPRAAGEKGVLRKAAEVLAQGASSAARFAGQVKDDIAKDLRKLASDAWSVAAGPLLIGGLALVLLSSGDKRGGQSDALLWAGAIFLASRVL